MNMQTTATTHATLLALVLAATLLLPAGAAATPDTPGPEAATASPVATSILGVRIGMTLEQVHTKLEDQGEVVGRETRSGGRKEAWQLDGTPFTSVALKTDRGGKVVWVSGFRRPGQELPFTELGAADRADRWTDVQAIWNVETDGGGYRLVAKGQDGRARVIYLLALGH